MKVEHLDRAQKLADLRAARLKDRAVLLAGTFNILTIQMKDGNAVTFTSAGSRASAQLAGTALEEIGTVLEVVLDRVIAGYGIELKELGVELEPEKVGLQVVAGGEPL